MQYKVLTAQGSWLRDVTSKLEADVQAHIRDGWEPLGGSNSVYRDGANDSTYTLQQAMIKKEYHYVPHMR